MYLGRDPFASLKEFASAPSDDVLQVSLSKVLRISRQCGNRMSAS
jgi:hypothetical protein